MNKELIEERRALIQLRSIYTNELNRINLRITKIDSIEPEYLKQYEAEYTQPEATAKITKQ